jgi:MHS family proline/betaine transporter-like MFS transporter
MIRYSSVSLMVFSYPLLSLIDKSNLAGIILALSLLIVINEMLLGASNAYLKNLFPMQYRYRGVALSFCLGMSVVGGLTPIIENYFYQLTGSFSASAIWLALIGLGVYVTIKKNKLATTARHPAAAPL